MCKTNIQTTEGNDKFSSSSFSICSSMQVDLSGTGTLGESYYNKFRIGDPPTTPPNTLDDVDIPQQPPNWILHVDQFGRTSAKAGNT